MLRNVPSCDHAWCVMVWRNERWVSLGWGSKDEATAYRDEISAGGEIASAYPSTPTYCYCQ